jgi:pimeloyl-ACP methyl ester carboxylesterase
LWGANDPVIPIGEARDLVSKLPNARLVVIADGAHGLIFDAPDAFNEAVCAFLAEVAPKGEAGQACRLPGSDDASV